MEPEVRAALHAVLPAYEVDGELGRGAFGVVYAGRHIQLGREVAIKELPAAFAADPIVRGRFVSEARTVASLDHPHIVPVYDFVENESACLLIMERCTHSVGDRFKSDGIVTDEACAAVLACLAALDFAHGRGLLHRDVKPENLMYDQAGTVKLADFGIARALDSDIRRTATGMVVGTPAYMSPEQVRGDDLTPASDVYSVAMMAYELLSGTLPFPEGTSVNALLAHHLVTEPVPLRDSRPELPGGISAVVDRALAKELDVRHPSAAEFAGELAHACVTAFGSGWLRRRRFTLHWPDIVAITEGPAPDSPRTGTIMVRAQQPAHEVIAPSHALADDGDQAPEPQPPAPAPPVAPAPRVAPAPPAAPPAPVAPPTGTGPATSRARWIVGAAAVLVVLALVVAAFALTGRDRGELASESEPDVATAPEDATTESTVPDDSAGSDADSSEFSNRPDGYDSRVADSWLAPTPCPDGQARVACIISGVAYDQDTDELVLGFFAEGFVPELEPPGFHVHFYFDSSVSGDERRAGSAVAGGDYRLWDQPFTVTSTNGENGRSMYTLTDAEAADARFLCSIVADADQIAIPDSGNCAPMPRAWNPDDLRAQLDRPTGEFVGSCGIDAMAIVPVGWDWVDLTTTPLDQAAEFLTPTAVTETVSVLETITADGGVVVARGGFGTDPRTAEVILSTFDADFTYDDSPDVVRDRLALLGINADAAVAERHGTRDVLTITTTDGESTTKRFVFPGAGTAVEVSVTAAIDTDLVSLADGIAGTVVNC